MNKKDWGTPEEQEIARKGFNIVDGVAVPLEPKEEQEDKDE